MQNLPKNSVRDDSCDYVQEKRYFTGKDFCTFATTVSGGIATLCSGFNNVTGQYTELGKSPTGLWAMRYASCGDNVSAPTILWQVPLHSVDNNWPVSFRILWGSDVALSTSATFPVLYWSTISGGMQNSAGTVVRTGVAPTRPVTALSLAFGTTTKTSAAVNALTWSGYGKIAPLATGGFANQSFHPDADALNLELRFATLSLANVATNFIWVAAVEMLYTPKHMFGPQSTRQARHMMKTLGNQETDPTTNF